MRIAILISCLFLTQILNAQLSLSPIFGENMVLQQSSDAAIWGWDTQGIQTATWAQNWWMKRKKR